jgi:hypothetical protein
MWMDESELNWQKSQVRPGIKLFVGPNHYLLVSGLRIFGWNNNLG